MTSESIYHRSMLMVVAGGLFLSTLGLGMRFIESASSMQITLYRGLSQFIFMALVLIIRYNMNRKSAKQPFFANWGFKEVRSGLLFSGASVFLVLAINNTSVANTMLIVSLAPLITGVAAWFLLGESVSKATIIAIVIAVFGVSIMVGGALNAGGILGITFAFIMMIFYGSFAVSLRTNTSGSGIVISCIGSFFVVAIIAPFLLFQGGFDSSSFQIGMNDLIICTLLGVFQVGLGTLLLINGAKQVPAAKVTLLAMLEVILSPVWVWLAVGEVPTIATLVGGAFIIIAISYQIMRATKPVDKSLVNEAHF